MSVPALEAVTLNVSVFVLPGSPPMPVTALPPLASEYVSAVAVPAAVAFSASYDVVGSVPFEARTPRASTASDPL